MDCSPPGSSVHGYSPGKSTGVGCHALLQSKALCPVKRSQSQKVIYCKILDINVSKIQKKETYFWRIDQYLPGVRRKGKDMTTKESF